MTMVEVVRRKWVPLFQLMGAALPTWIATLGWGRGNEKS
jgi:hypothetical protein